MPTQDKKVSVSMKMTPKQSGALYMKCIKLEKDNKAMESVLSRIAGTVGTPDGDVFALADRICELVEKEKK